MANIKVGRTEAPRRATTARRAARRIPDAGGRTIELDRFRTFLFPNRVREQRQRRGFPKLLGLAGALPEIPYIRLSKIERGEIFARADELRRIASALAIDPQDLLIETDEPGFDIAAWSAPFRDGRPVDVEEERFAVMLGAALRARRTGDAALTIASLDSDYGLPPVILSRIENALKPLDRWNDATRAALCRVFGVDSEAELRALVVERYHAGELDSWLEPIANPAVRAAKTAQRVAALRSELAGAPQTAAIGPAATPSRDTAPEPDGESGAPAPDTSRPSRATVPVYGSALPNGLIAFTPTGTTVEAPAVAGPAAFGLRVCRPTLGGGLPGHATVIVDPDRFPAAGGLGAIRERDGYRLVTVTLDREGRMKGFSVNPDIEIALDTLDPTMVAAVVAGLFV